MSRELPTALDALQSAVRAGRRFKFIFFWGHKPRRPSDVDESCLSQWYGAPFVVDDVRYPTAEHFMMASKARLFGDEKRLKDVLSSSSPGAAKAAGRQVRGFDQGVWEENRANIVETASYEKFRQNEALGAYLRGTSNRVLVEASPQDRIWGIGLERADSKASNPLQWQGLNLLGFALMRARIRLTAPTTENER